MGKRLTTEEFIERAREVHGNRYDYSLVEYQGATNKVTIICRFHNEPFEQTPDSHYQGSGCPKCGYLSMANKQGLTTEEFVKKARKVHGNRYDYDLVNYKKASFKVKIRCRRHGIFLQTPGRHLSGSGCIKCGFLATGNNLRMTTKEFTEKARAMHGDRYDYSKVDYINKDVKVIIICRLHKKEFKQSPSAHCRGQGCPDCGLLTVTSTIEGMKLTTDEFIAKATKVHGNKYDYSLVGYSKSSVKVKIVCPITGHGIFKQKPNHHLAGIGCPKCGVALRGSKRRLTTEKFIAKAIETHGDKYDYSLINYQGSRVKVEITCPLPGHGVFLQEPRHHLAGIGCPSCSESTGEKTIATLLDRLDITYLRQHTFDACRSPKNYLLPFDFYVTLPAGHGLIEYDGGQHFKPVDYFGGKETFHTLQQNDAIKNRFATAHNIPLLRIPYHQFDNIEQVVLTWLDSLTQDGNYSRQLPLL